MPGNVINKCLLQYRQRNVKLFLFSLIFNGYLFGESLLCSKESHRQSFGSEKSTVETEGSKYGIIRRVERHFNDQYSICSVLLKKSIEIELNI